jgi:hypothetical protein
MLIGWEEVIMVAYSQFSFIIHGSYPFIRFYTLLYKAWITLIVLIIFTILYSYLVTSTQASLIQLIQ